MAHNLLKKHLYWVIEDISPVMRGSLTLLGSVLHLSKNNKLVAKSLSKAFPKIGDPVYDDKSRVIGSVYDVIGPISSPYILIKPSSEIDPDDLRRIKKVYVLLASKGRRR
jgi:rRNA processing protein Gar1